MWVLTSPITERSTIDLNGNLATACPWSICMACAGLCVTVRGCTQLQAAFRGPWVDPSTAPGIVVDARWHWCRGTHGSPKPVHLTGNRAQLQIQVQEKCVFLYVSIARFPFVICFLLGVAEINISQFGVFPLSFCAVPQGPGDKGSAKGHLLWFIINLFCKLK